MVSIKDDVPTEVTPNHEEIPGTQADEHAAALRRRRETARVLRPRRHGSGIY